MHRRGTPSFRRSATMLATALVGLALAAPWTVLAQGQATPDAPTGPIMSQTREEVQAEINEELGYSEAATPGGTFVAATTGDIQTIHPLLFEDEDSLAVVSRLYDGLVGTDVRTGGPAPTGLADSWEIAPDGVTYTFHLNTDARWHDGVDITAGDVQFSFDALANPDVGSAYTQSFLDTVASWRVIDDDTFEVVAEEPLFTFLYDIATWIIPKHVWENVPVAEWRTDPGATGQDPARVVGSGAWKFQEWRPGESVTLVRNDDYYQKVPYLDAYVIRIWPDQTAVVNALLNGEIDRAALDPSDVETVKATPGLEVATFPTSSFTYYMTNLDPEKTELFLDQRVRQALFSALDRESIVKDILLGNAEVAHGTQPVISYAYAPERITTKYPFDPDKARALLAEAGWSDTNGDGVVDKDGQPLSFELIYPSGSPTIDQVVTYMQDAWQAIGVAMTPRAMDFSALVQVLTEDRNFEAALLGLGWDTSFIQDAMFGCDQYEGGFNLVKYCNEKVDALNDEAERTFDEASRRELLIEVTNIINDELPVAVMYFSKDNIGYSDRLQNFKPGFGGVDLAYVWIQT